MEQKEKTGFIYVLTNESFHKANWIKIGYAEDVERRVRDLSGTSVPLPYKVYCTYEIPRINGSKDPDKLVHNLIQLLNPGLRISPNREFFEIDPWDAYDMLSAIAQMHGRSDKLKLYEVNESDKPEPADEEYSVESLFPPKTEIALLFNKISNVILSIDNAILFSKLQIISCKFIKSFFNRQLYIKYADCISLELSSHSLADLSSNYRPAV